MTTAQIALNASERRTPKALVPATARFAIAVAVAAALSAVWIGAGDASHHAVDTTTAALSRNVTYVTLPAVTIVGRREDGSRTASAAAAGLRRETAL